MSLEEKIMAMPDYARRMVFEELAEMLKWREWDRASEYLSGHCGMGVVAIAEILREHGIDVEEYT